MRPFKRITFCFLLSLLSLNVFLKAEPQYFAPDFLAEKIRKNYYDGNKNDLLTAGWSKQQLAQRKLPNSDQKIDAQWLRKAAYYNNIIALIDTTEAGGYSKLFGPLNSTPISGYEYLTNSLDDQGEFAATLALQIPDNFNWKTPCIIVAASSGSRGIYGAVGTVGSWALTNQCAVAYTDKSTGTGFYFFDSDSGYTVDGLYRKKHQNTLSYVDKNTEQNKAFLAKYPTAISTKHAYSLNNVEKDSGRFVEQAAKFALYQINQHFQTENNKQHLRLNKQNTLIIAASISNGGAASLQAGELDRDKLFDGIVAAEPNIYIANDTKVTIQHNNTGYVKGNKNSYQYFVSKNLFGPCALLTEKASKAPFSNHPRVNKKKLNDWCQQLRSDGYLVSKEYNKLPEEALQIISNIAGNRKVILEPLMQVIDLWPALAMTYSNQYGLYNLAENLCSVYFSAIDSQGKPVQLTEPQRQRLFADSNGIPPTAGIKLVSSTQSDAYRQAKCFYQASKESRIENGLNAIQATANLNSIPTIIIHGQDDNLINPNLSSRPYYARAQANDSNLNIKYYEVTNAQHFDAFAALPMYATEFIPLHYYFEKSLDLMLAHLTENKSLPPSQVVKTNKRQVVHKAIEPITFKHLPAIKMKPTSEIKLKRINSDELALIIPD